MQTFRHGAMTVYYPKLLHTPSNKGCPDGENHLHPQPMSDYQTIEPNAFEVGISPLFDGVTMILEHDGHKTVVVMPPAAALGCSEMMRQAANKALEQGPKVKTGRSIDQKEIVPRPRPERLDS